MRTLCRYAEDRRAGGEFGLVIEVGAGVYSC
jgi:hypothetical protein